jgi:hypothetical protein
MGLPPVLLVAIALVPSGANRVSLLRDDDEKPRAA